MDERILSKLELNFHQNDLLFEKENSGIII